MASEIKGYNSVFKSFVDFARQRIDANDANAVAVAKHPLDDDAAGLAGDRANCLGNEIMIETADLA